MSSKKFDEERKKSPTHDNTKDIKKPLISKNIRYPQASKIKNFSLDRGGFYLQNKPVKSPSTSTYPSSPKGLSVNKSYANKKFGGIPSYVNTSLIGKRDVGGKPNNVTISSLRVSRNINSTTYDDPVAPKEREGSVNITPQPSKMPNLSNQSFGLYQSSGLGGGGLSRASGMSLGRHQV